MVRHVAVVPSPGPYKQVAKRRVSVFAKADLKRPQQPARPRSPPKAPATPAAPSPQSLASLKKLEAAIGSGEVFNVYVKSVNRGGAVAMVEDIRAFIPRRNLDSAKLVQDPGDLSTLVGKTIRVKVVEIAPADEPASSTTSTSVAAALPPAEIAKASPWPAKVILSEKAAVAADALASLQPGTITTGVVSRIEMYGAFVDLDGMGEGVEVTGLVHKSQLSWDAVMSVGDVVQAGDKVTVKVLEVEPKTGRVQLSIRETQADPLKEGFKSLAWEQAEVRLPEVSMAVSVMRQTPGIIAVELGPQAQEKRKASQEFELYMTRDDLPDGFQIVARVGSTLQQLNVRTTLPREDMKALLKDVLSKCKNRLA